MGTTTRLLASGAAALATGAAVWLICGSAAGALVAVAGVVVAVAPVLALAGDRDGGVEADNGALGAERAILIRTCLYVRDRLTSAALADRMDRGLAEAGVTMLDPVGERFDPSRHEAGGTTPTRDRVLVGTVAVVEVPGYADHGALLRAPVVTVYQESAGGRR